MITKRRLFEFGHISQQYNNRAAYTTNISGDRQPGNSPKDREILKIGLVMTRRFLGEMSGAESNVQIQVDFNIGSVDLHKPLAG